MTNAKLVPRENNQIERDMNRNAFLLECIRKYTEYSLFLILSSAEVALPKRLFFAWSFATNYYWQWL